MVRRFINFLTVISGCAGLIYELLWFRVLDLRFGVSSHAVATTLAVFMLGLGLGGAWFGRLADRAANPWRLFWRLEVGTAVTTLVAFAVAWWNPAADRIFALTSLFASPVWQWGTRLLLAAALILPATACMGGIVPVLARACTTSRAQIGARFGALYACNTLGAVLGAVLGGYVLVRVLGVTGSVLVAVALNLVVAAVAFVCGSPESRPPVDVLGKNSLEGETPSSRTPNSRLRNFCRHRGELCMQRRHGGDKAPPSTGILSHVSIMSSGGRRFVAAVPCRVEDAPQVADAPQAYGRAWSFRRQSFWRLTRGSGDTVAGCAGGAIVFLGGFSLIGYEVLWSRIMTNQGASTSYALSVLLVAVLLGLTCGGALAAAMADRVQQPRAWLGALFALAVVVLAQGMLTLLQSGPLRAVMAILAPNLGGGAVRIVLQETLGGGLVIFLMAVLWGWLFPLAVRTFVDDVDVLGTGAGRLQGINAAGMACGSVATGFLFLPLLGLKGAHGALLGATGLATLLALWPGAGRIGLPPSQRMLRRTGRGRPPTTGKWCCRSRSPNGEPIDCMGGSGGKVLYATGVICFVVASFGLTCMLYRQTPAHHFRQSSDETLYYYGEGAGATVTVLGRTQDGHVYKNLLVDSHSVSGDYPGLLPDCKLLAHVPLMLAARPGRAATVGFGTGGTSYSMRRYGAAVTAIEIEPCVVEASREFPGINGGVLCDPGFTLVMDDARHHFARTAECYDVIVTDVTSPKYKRNVYLYTREYFARLRARLAPGGVAAAWIPFAGLSDADVRMIVATFDSVFPHTTLWAMIRDRTAFLLVIGTLEPLRLDLAVWQARFAAVRADLAVIDIGSPAELAGLLRLGEADVDRYTRGAPLNTDNRPRLEFSDLDAYLRVSHWPVYQAMRQAQQEDLAAYATGSAAEIAAMRVALAAARTEADSWGARHLEVLEAERGR